MASSKHLFSDQLRRAIDASGMTRYEICNKIRLAEATMSRFMSGKGGLSIEKIDAIAALLRIEIVSGRSKNKKG